MLISEGCIIPKSAKLDEDVNIGPRVVLAGDGIIIRSGCKIDAGCIIGEGVTIGQNAWVRAGSVVLQSLPPNAIVEGNPANLVGYNSGNGGADRPQPRHIDTQSFDHLKRPTCVPLGVGESAIYLMRRISDARGSLTVGEVPNEVPFSPARYFAVFDVPTVELRGEHAHKKCEQFLICLHGSCRVLLDNGEERCEVTLDRPDLGVYMPAMIWGTQFRYSKDAALLVFASRPYEEEDYLRTYDDFIMELGENRL